MKYLIDGRELIIIDGKPYLELASAGVPEELPPQDRPTRVPKIAKVKKGRPSRIGEESKAEIIRMFKEGKTPKQIYKARGYKLNAIYRVLKLAGLGKVSAKEAIGPKRYKCTGACKRVTKSFKPLQTCNFCEGVMEELTEEEAREEIK